MPSLDPSTKLAATATALAARLATVATVNRVYEYDPMGQPIKPPVITVGLPTIERHGIDEAELEVGKDDWHTTWPVTLYVQIQDPQTATLDVHRLVGALIQAVDADPTLGGEADEAKLIDVTPDENDEAAESRQYVIRCRVEARLMLPN